MNNIELVKMLVNQHQLLQEYLKSAISDDDRQLESLELFKKVLKEHLETEDKVFYPKYLKIKKDSGEGVEEVVKFIEQMSEIGKIVTGFMEKYANEETIRLNKILFQKELEEISNTLNLRIETEEEGVYDIFLAMN